MSSPEAKIPLTLPPELAEVLESFDGRIDDFDEDAPLFEIERKKAELGELTENQKKAVMAERAALSMDLVPGKQLSPWGTRYETALSEITPEGKYIGSPDIANIDNAAVEYLKERTAIVKHPVLRARYADFLWDMTEAAVKKRPSIEMARQAVDSYVECGRRFPDSDDVDVRLSRALELALSVSDKGRVVKVVDAMLGLLEKCEYPGGHALWLFALLVGQKGVTLSEDQEKTVVDALEAELSQVCDSENAYPVAAKGIAIQLGKYYERKGQAEDAKRAIRKYGNAMHDLAMHANGILGMTWLQDVYSTYVEFGMKEEAASLQIAAKKKGKDAEGEMVRHAVAVDIPAEKMEELLGELTADDLESTLARISINFCPRVDELQTELDEINRETIFLPKIHQSILDDQQVVARLGPMAEDPEGHQMRLIGQHLQFMAGTLAATIDRMRSKYDVAPASMRDFFAESVLFGETRLPLLERAIDAYLSDDHITAIHILTPQIEHALRSLLGVLGKPTNKHRRSDTGVMVEKSLNDILENESAIGERLGEDFTLYIRAVLCDARGLNVRNRLAHGLMDCEEFCRGISDVLLHIAWSLAFVRAEGEVD